MGNPPLPDARTLPGNAARILRGKDAMVVLQLLACLLSGACLVVDPARAQETGPPRTAQAAPGIAPDPSRTESAATAGDPVRADLVTLNFDGVDLVEVIHVLARHLRLNYTIDPDVSGLVTLFSGQPLRRDDLLPIFHEILRIHGAAAVRQGDFYRITAVSRAPGLAGPGRLDDGGLVMQVLPVRYFSVAAMKRLLAPFMSEGGTMLDHAGGNYLVAVDLPSNIRRLSEIKALIDVEAFAGARMEMYEPKAATAPALAREMSAAMSFSAASGAQGEAFAARFLPLPRIDRLLVIAYSEAAWNYVKQWLHRIDVADRKPGRRIFIRPIENRNAAELARVLNQVYGSGRSSPAGAEARSRAGGPTAIEGFPLGAGDAAGRSGVPAPGEVSAKGSEAFATGRGPPTTGQPALEKAGHGVRVVAEPDTNSLVILATAREYAAITEALDSLDLVPRQVLMEVLVAEVTLTDDFEFGLEYALSTGGFGAADSDSAADTALQTLGAGFSSIIDAGRDFRAFVKALMQDARVKVLSSPHLLALDNRPARIRVGSEQPVATGVVVSQEARAATTTIQFKNVGRILTIVPRINSEGLVNLQARVEVSDVGERVLVGAQSFAAFNVRDAETTAVLQDGQTLVIGGIITDSLRRTRVGIPLLMDVPVLGRLFRTDLERSDRTELVILITPRVIRDRREGERVTERFLDKVRAVRRELEAGAAGG